MNVYKKIHIVIITMGLVASVYLFMNSTSDLKSKSDEQRHIEKQCSKHTTYTYDGTQYYRCGSKNKGHK
jgi:hypothetical protein